jgi:hypothetical protein
MIIADATQCLEKDGVTDIHIIEPQKYTVQLEHVSKIFPFFPWKGVFQIVSLEGVYCSY